MVININKNTDKETRCDALESGNGREDDEIEENCSKNQETAKKYYWCYLVRGKRTKYPPKINEVLERNFQNQAPQTKWAESGKIFVVDFGKMKETVIKMTKNKNMDDGGKEKRDNDEKGEDDEKGDDDEKGVDEDDDEEEIDVERVAEDDGWATLNKSIHEKIIKFVSIDCQQLYQAT
ncbi:hypothetical protein HELRODRAFT_166554 [Helobdella robusta]|uniref:WWE domain-containing protein n=1 Tax=Helobdella robusta TaxID=6412 RepID=T1EY88_HELRO|nr:hypothetical protein HELRODRAFT_166554 [Helobdella robusta]ESO11553.1 hypothetical protein HELRODRAFT_166554 [Helobdella robusta]